MYTKPDERDVEAATELVCACRDQIAWRQKITPGDVHDSDVRKAVEVAMNFARQRGYEEDAARYAKAGD